MPLARITMNKGKSPEYIQQLSQGLQDALVEAYFVPESEVFQIIEQIEPGSFLYSRKYGVEGERTDDFIVVNVESDGRRRADKQAFIAALAKRLQVSPGIAPDDVFVRLSTNTVPDDWSLGGGVMVSEIEDPALTA